MNLLGTGINYLLFELFWWRCFEFGWILDFLSNFEVALELLHDRVQGVCGNEDDEPETNQTLPQFFLGTYGRRWNTKLIINSNIF